MSDGKYTEQFNELVKNVSIEDIVLDAMEVHADRDYFLQTEKRTLPLNLDEKILSAAIVDRSKGLFRVRHRASLKAKVQRKIVLKIHSIFTAVYKVPPDLIDEENIRLFAEMDSRLHIWPYQRELIQSIMTRMGLPPFVLPPMVFVPEDLEE